MTEPLQLDTVAGLPQWSAIDPDTGVPMDGRGRYLVPDVGETERSSWQRCTSLAGSLAERYALEIHAQNALLLGLGARPDLRDLAATVNADDKVALRKLRGEALAAGGRDVKANHGTAFHELSRPLDWAYVRGTLGEDLHDLIRSLDSDQRGRVAPMLHAYANALIHHDIQMPDGIECVLTGDPTEIVFHDPRIGVVGRNDKVRKIAGRNVIVDLKTGDDPMKYGGVEIAMQLAIAAHAPYYWYERDGTHGSAIPVDRETAYVLHVPHGKDYAELIAVDIAQGWRWVYLALQVRALHGASLESFAMPLGRISSRETIHAPGAGSQPGRIWPWQGSMAAAVAVGLPAVVDAPPPISYCLRCQHEHAPGACSRVTSPPAPDGTEVRVLVQGGVTMAPGPAVTPPATTEAPPAGGEEQGSAEPAKRQRACSRCRRPGHQARSCTYVTAVAKDGSGQLTPIIDERTTTLIASGKASDPENVAPGGGVAVTAELARTQPTDSPPWCTCASGWEHGWSNRGDGVWVHAAPGCGKPNYAAGARAQAAHVLQTSGDDSGMAREAVAFFTSNPGFPPPQRVIDAGWPPPYIPPSNPAEPAGSISTSGAPALSIPGMSNSTETSTAPPATTATPPSPPSMASPSPSATPASSISTAVPAADFSQIPTNPADWPHYLSASQGIAVLTERVQQCIAADAWDQQATAAAMRRQGELPP